MLSCEEVASEEEDCCNHQAALSLAEGDAEVEEGEQEMLIGVVELIESVRLLRLRLNLAEDDVEVEEEEEGEQEMLIGVVELIVSFRLLRLRLNLIFTDALWDMSGCVDVARRGLSL